MFLNSPKNFSLRFYSSLYGKNVSAKPQAGSNGGEVF